MVNLLPTIRLAQSIWKRQFPSVDKPLKKGLWKIYAPGLIFGTLQYLPFLFNFGQNKLKPSQQNKTDFSRVLSIFCWVSHHWEGVGWGGGVKWAHHRPQVYPVIINITSTKIYYYRTHIRKFPPTIIGR